MRDPERQDRSRRDPSHPAGAGRGPRVLIGLVIVALLVVVLVWILPSFTGQMDDTAVEITSGNASSAEGESVPGESDSMDVPAQNEPQDDGSSDNPG